VEEGVFLGVGRYRWGGDVGRGGDGESEVLVEEVRGGWRFWLGLGLGLGLDSGGLLLLPGGRRRAVRLLVWEGWYPPGIVWREWRLCLA